MHIREEPQLTVWRQPNHQRKVEVIKTTGFTGQDPTQATWCPGALPPHPTLPKQSSLPLESLLVFLGPQF